MTRPHARLTGRRPLRVLVPDDNYTATLAAVRALRAGGYEPWLACSAPGAFAARSRAIAGTVTTPDAAVDADGFAATLAAEARRLNVAAVVPGTETGLAVLAGRNAEFAPPAVLAVPAREVVERAMDKGVLAELAPGVGLLTPPTLTLRPGDSLDRLEFPAVVKSATKSVAVGDEHTLAWVKRVSSRAELAESLERLPGATWLVQPFLSGALAAVCGVIWDGELVCAAHQVAHRIWPVPCGGSSYAETVPREPEVEQRATELLRAIGWSGLFNLQYIRRPEGDYVIDLNTRFYGSLALTVAAGLNLPAIWLDLELGRRPSIGRYRPGTRFRSEERDGLAIRDLLRRGRRAEAAMALLPRPRTTHGVFSLRDPGPFARRLAAKLL